MASAAHAQQRLPYVVEPSAPRCDTVYTLPTSEATMNGGTDGIYDFFFKNLKNSSRMTLGMSPKMVLIKMLIADEGEVLSTRVLKSFDEELSNDILHTAGLFPKFEPALYDGKKVCSYRIIKLYFSE